MYDFTTRVDRTETGSSKWDAMVRACPDIPAGIVPFSVADMEFVTMPEIVDAAVSYACGSILGYTVGTDSYYRAVLDWQRVRHGWSAERDWVVTAAGVVSALGVAVEAFTRPGDGVVIMTPVYHPFRRLIERSRRTVVEVPLKLDDASMRYSIDFDALERACRSPKTTLLIMCSPHNPVGRVWLHDELAALARICCDNGVFICSDEIHGDLVMPGYRHTPLPLAMPDGMLSRCAVFTAPSKTFNLAGVQCSNVFIPDPQRREAYAIAARDRAFFSSLNAFAYPLCEAAYTKGAVWLDEAIGVIEGNHRFVGEFCSQKLPMLRVFPLEGTYLQWVDFRALGLDADDLDAFLMREALLFLDAGTMFGTQGSGFQRINIACPRAVLAEAFERLEAAIRSRLP